MRIEYTHPRYQIYVERNDGCGLSLEGCWGSDQAGFNDLLEACQGAEHLASLYPDCAWVIMNEHRKVVIARIEATASV